MPELSRFFGIIITMYFDDHAPPHFHAAYNEDKVVIEIETLEVVEGKMRPKQLSLIREWAALHMEELRQAWSRASQFQNPQKIEPLKSK